MRVEQFIQENREKDIQARFGAEKTTWKVNLNGKWVAAKVFNEKDIDGQKIDQNKRAREELHAYIELIKTPLKVYIPPPICLLWDQTSKGVVGLAVEWREATLLSDLFPKKILSLEDINGLEQLFFNFVGARSVPSTDMLNESNLMIERTREKPKIWFAECGLVTSSEEIQAYSRHLDSMINALKKDYAFD
jgi:hypothetical protein